jgi:hypothetical protein
MMKFLVDSYPIETPPTTSPQIARILVLGFGTFKFRKYSMSDFLQFVKLSDMRILWSENAKIHDFNENHSQAPEVQICKSFLKSIAWKADDTIRDWWSFVRQRLIVIDQSSIDFFWPKYSSKEFRYLDYSTNTKFSEFTFADWTALLSKSKIEATDGVQADLF